MSRRARNVFAGIAHHITQRGNNRECVFRSPDDYQWFLALLLDSCHKSGVAVPAFCLMPNHLHLIAVPKEEDSLARALRRALGGYAVEFNRRTARSGHLWQGRFFSCPLDREHFSRAVRYVELNPVRAGLVNIPTGWDWSSAARSASPQTLPDEDAQLIRRATRLGEPLGSKNFLSDLEQHAGRSLLVAARGRPKR
jgi:putative transposase